MDKCGKCSKKVKKEDQGIQCDGYCDGWFHVDCTNITSEQYKMITDLGNCVLWLCENCRSILKANREKNIKANDKMNMVNLLVELKGKLSEIEEKVKTATHVIEHNLKEKVLQKTFAEVVASEIESPRSDQRRTDALPGMIILPKVEQMASETKKDLYCFKSTFKQVGLEDVRQIKKGGVVLKTRSEDEMEMVVQKAKELLSNKYEIKKTLRRNPRIIIKNVEHKYKTDEIIKKLNDLNTGFNIKSGELKIITYKTIKDVDSRWHIILELIGPVYKKLVNRYVTLNWKSYYIKEDINVMRCYNCQGYFHKASNYLLKKSLCKMCW